MANPSGNYHQWRSQWRNTFELFFPTWKWCWVLLVGPWDIIFNLTLRVLHLNHETRGVLRSNNLFGMHFEPQALKSNGIMIATCISRFTRMVIRITNPEKMKIDFKQNPKSSYDVTAKLISESNGLRSNSFFYSPKGEDAEDREVQRDNQWMYFQIHHWMNGQICTIIHLTTIIHWLHLHSCAKTWSWLDSRTMVANQ